jgi:hypothetical protein
MRSKTIIFTLAVCFIASAFCFASHDVQLGTWKLNEAKSKLAAGTGKNLTVVYEMAGENIKITVDGVDKDGNPTHNEWTGKFDGKAYPVTGDPNSDMRSYEEENNGQTLDMKIEKAGKTTITGEIVVSKDGKTRTVHTKGTNAEGKKIESHAEYDKQ